MGSGQGKQKKKNAQQKKPIASNQETKAHRYDDDAIDTANLAIAIQKEDLTTNIELFVHCENLPKMDAFSLTDPMVVAYKDVDDKYVFIDRTEVLPETLNPKFVKTFIVSYNFEKKQKLRFEIYDIDDFDCIDNFEKQEIIGYVECEIHDIVCAPTQSISRTIINKKSNRKRNGILHIRGAEYDMGANKILFQIGAQQFSTRSEIMLRMSYFTDNKDWMPIYASEPIKNQRKQMVEFVEFALPLSKFGNNEQAQVRIEIEEYNKTKGTFQLGECEMTLQGMLDNSGKFLRMMKNGILTGQVKLLKVVQHSRYSFLQYIYSGSKIQLIMGLDFTNSNQPSNNQSLLNAFDGKNEYIKAISQVMGILQYFNNENRIPIYGFGAKLPPYYNIVSHCFACTGNIFEPFVYGSIDEIITVYRETVKAVTFHGPTVFSQIIDQAIKYAEHEKIDQQKYIFIIFSQKYYILIIFTDGSINDIHATIDQLLRAQQFPISIIIVGIGSDDFTNIRALDADDTQLYSRNKNENVQKDLVQFIDFKKVQDNQELLAREIFAEIPRQFLDYMDKNKIYPAKGKKNSKAATNEFIHSKIEEKRKLKKKEFLQIGKMPQFLKKQRDDFINSLMVLGYDLSTVQQIINEGIPAIDVNLVIEYVSEYSKQNPHQTKRTPKSISNRSEIAPQILEQLKQSDIKESKVNHRIFCIKQKNKLDELIHMKKEKSQLVTSNFLYNLTNQETKKREEVKPQMRRKYVNLQPILPPVNNTQQNLCLGCQENPIEVIFMPCGHACSCMECFYETQACISCKSKVQMIAKIQK